MNKVLNIGALVLDERLQSRTEIDEATVSEYAENIKAGDEFPPVLVYFCGVHYWLTDGYHRYHAHRRAEKVSILCEVVHGTQRDAILYSTSVNATHGMRRTHADKRKAVMTLLDDFEWMQMSNYEIAKHCAVSISFVSNLRTSNGKQNVETVKYRAPSGEILEKKKATGRPPKKEQEPELKEPQPEKKVEEYDPRDELIQHLTKENDDLTMNLALAHLGGTEEEQSEARELMNAMREEIRVLKIELTAVKQSRDTFQSENSQLKKQVLSMQRQLKKEQA
jgi:uncharacterized ParB-like nuclease family protein